MWLRCFRVESHFCCFICLCKLLRYAYSEEVGEESDDEEALSLTKGKQEGQGELSLVRQEKNARTDASSDEDDESDEDKRE